MEKYKTITNIKRFFEENTSRRFSSFKVLPVKSKKFNGGSFTAIFDIPDEDSISDDGSFRFDDEIRFNISGLKKGQCILEYKDKQEVYHDVAQRAISFFSKNTGTTNRQSSARSMKLNVLIQTTLRYCFEYFVDLLIKKNKIPKVFHFFASGDTDNKKRKAYEIFCRSATKHRVPYTLGNPKTAFQTNSFYLVHKPLYDQFCAEVDGNEENNDVQQ